MRGWDTIVDFTKEPQLTHTHHGPQSIPLCGIWRLRERQEWSVATTAFSLSHVSNQCEWAPDIIPNDSNYRQPPNLKYQPICKAWSTDTRPGCSYANCAYKRICWYCSNDAKQKHPRCKKKRGQVGSTS